MIFCTSFECKYFYTEFDFIKAGRFIMNINIFTKKIFPLILLSFYFCCNSSITFSQTNDFLAGELNKYAHPLPASPLSYTDTDLIPFDEYSELKILGLGEATHGTKEFFQMKHRLFKYFVEKHNYKIFAFEADMGECIYIDRFICKGIGTINDVMNKMYFWTWMTEEVKELILWMKSYNENKSPDKQIHFLGFDCQTIRHVHNIMTEYLSRCNITLRLNQERILDELDLGSSSFSLLTSAQILSYKAKCDSVISLLEENNIKAESVDEHEQMKQLMVQVKQVIDVKKQIVSRDKYMADNVVWFLSLYGGDNKIAAWAHNGHISKGSSTSMGHYMQVSLGNQYQAVGFSFNNGNFRAVNLDVETGSYTGLITHTISIPPIANSSNYIFMMSNSKNFALIFKDITPSTSLINWLGKSHPFLMIGSIYTKAHYTSFFSNSNLAANYDAIIHFRTSSASIAFREIPIGITDPNNSLTKNYILLANYPNPFNPATNIRFSLPRIQKSLFQFLTQ